MAVTSNETEIKYEATAGVILPAFTQLPQVARAEEAEQEDLDAEYFDTEDLRLISSGITLRRRQGGHDAGWHLKLPAGSHTRREITLPLGRSRHRVPAQLARLVRVHARGKDLKPVARISTARTRQVLVDGAGKSLAEVASDDVTAAALGESQRVSRWHEVEVELTGGDRDLLEAADLLLRRSGLSRSDQSPKLARALDLPPAPTQRQAGPGAAAGDVLLAYLQAQVSMLKSVDPMVRTDEQDAVHQMRTTTRRLRSTLQTFLSFFGRPQADELIDGLRWLGGELGAARDAEVLAAQLQTQVSELPADLAIGPVAARVREHFARIGAEAQTGLLASLDSPRYFALLDGLDDLAARPPGTRLAGRPAAKVLPAAVRGTYQRTKRRMKHALSLPPGAETDVALHEARKAAKRARYAGEAVAPAFGVKALAFAAQMKKLQSVLGGHQDAVIARAAARELGMNADQAGESAFSYGVICEREDREARRLQRKAKRVWRTASRRRVRGWLG